MLSILLAYSYFFHALVWVCEFVLRFENLYGVGPRLQTQKNLLTHDFCEGAKEKAFVNLFQALSCYSNKKSNSISDTTKAKQIGFLFYFSAH